MAFLLVLLRLVEWVWYHVIINTCYGAARKMRSYVFHLGDLSSKPLQQPTSFPSILNCDLEGRESQTLACDIHKEAYVVHNGKCPGSIMPRDKYPKPLIFHDGRLAFLPTPSATLFMFMWLPIGLLLAIYRILLGFFLSWKWTFTLATWSGVVLNVKGRDLDCMQSKIPTVTQSGKSAPFILDQTDNIVNSSNRSLPSKLGQRSRSQLSTVVNPFPKGSNPQMSEPNKGILYVCTHRTLLDPVFLSSCLGKPLTTVTYSLSKLSELIAPIRTMRLTRDRKQDRDTMQRLLSEGDLVVCHEGTTCREPYLLRFSSLFAELADEIVPVALHADVSLFYGTTARGLKCLDRFLFLMNPRPCYHIEILGKVPKELTCAGGRSPSEVANYIQKQLGNALGFECTNITRRDKYLMLAENEGVAQEKKR